MNLRKIIRELLEEKFIEEKYPEEFSFQELESIKTYAGKLRYAEKYLEKLASGSARTVYKVDDQKVLKIAKNAKGIAQNEVEAQGYLQNYEIVAQVFETDYNDYWVEMELAQKTTPKEFFKLTGVTLKELEKYLWLLRMYKYGYKVTEQMQEKMDNNEFVQELMSFTIDNDMETGDFGRISSWGKVKRGGEDKIVLVDFGLTKSVYSDFYKVN